MKYPAYPGYKDSGVQWLGDVPEHWEVKRLKYSASINEETLPETTSPDFEFKYVDIGSVSPFDGITRQEPMEFEKAPSRARRIVREGDTIVSTVRTYLRAIAPVGEIDTPTIVSTGFAVIRPQYVDPAYLSYSLREPSFVESVVARSVGVSYPAVNASEVGDICIPLPPSVEQNAIAAFLDRETGRIDLLVAKKRELVERLQEKRAALISRTVTKGLPAEAARAAGLEPHTQFKPSGIEWLGEIPEGWDSFPLFRISETIQTGPFGSQLHVADYVENGIPLINPAHIIAGKLIPDDLARVDNATALRLNRHCLKEGDVVMGRRGEIGRCGVVTKKEVGWLCGTGSLLIRVDKEKSDADYLALLLSERGFKGLLELHAVGTTMLNINPTIVGRMAVAVPPLSEQAAIADYLDRETAKLDQLTQKVGKAIERLQEYRMALITAAVTGKICVKDEGGRMNG